MALTAGDLDQLIATELGERGKAHQLRARRAVEAISATRLRIDGREYVNFASNNYLGLTHHPQIIDAARTAAEEGVGAGAAALITGYTVAHLACEATVARWKGTGGAVLLPSGYQANHAAIQTLAALGARRGGVRFLVDKLAHASLLDAIRGSDAEFRVFPHNHLAKLGRLLREAPAQQMQVVVTESIFSMDGDAADLAGLARLKQKHDFVLLLDEAHASGVYGESGAGLAEELGLRDVVDVSVVTLSKALGCGGGAVCGSASMCEAVVNFGRAYVYTTCVPAMLARAAEAAVQVVQNEGWRRQRVRELARAVREAATAAGFDIPAGDSPIIPVILGEEALALKGAQTLLDQGLLAPAARPPTVAKGSARLRVTLSSSHTDEEIARLLDALARLRG